MSFDNQNFTTNPNFKFREYPAELRECLGTTFTYDVYKNKEGKTVLISPFWDINHQCNTEGDPSVGLENYHYIVLTDLSTNQEIKRLVGHTDRVVTCRFFEDPHTGKQYLVSADRKYKVKVWDLTDDGKLIFDKDRLQFVNKPCNDELKLIRNDIVICMSNGTKSLVGKTAQYDGSYPNELTVGAFCSIFRSNAPLAKYIFQTEYFKKYLYILLAGTNINNIKNSDLEKFIIKLPGYEEQEKITKFLNNFNKKIELIKLKKEKYENYKKSLLQNMFV